MLNRDEFFSIARFINDPKTWLNFSLVCRNTAQACKLIRLEKMNEFAKVDRRMGFFGCPCCDQDDRWEMQESKLPNGVRSHFFNSVFSVSPKAGTTRISI